MDSRPPRTLLPGSVVLATFIVLFCLLGRMVLPLEGPPAFCVVQQGGIWVELGQGFAVPGFCQYSDELTPEGIIKLTLGKDVPPDLLANPEWSRPLENGERLDVESNGNEINCLCRSWMSAEARMALFIPLHPDRMTLEDWTALSGIGPRLALRIEQHRQKYGDFKSLGTLQNVPGIGPKRISSWKVFF